MHALLFCIVVVVVFTVSSDVCVAGLNVDPLCLRGVVSRMGVRLDVEGCMLTAAWARSLRSIEAAIVPVSILSCMVFMMNELTRWLAGQA